jgi:2-polyprenyl-3-methyl-5-hydroxy-6-metoxy-1,4-benzoquinol methylase
MRKLVNRIRNWLAMPPRLVVLNHILRLPGVRVLDVGCGNHSSSVTKQFFPDCEYHGVDRMRWNCDDADIQAAARMFWCDLDSVSEVSRIPDSRYQVILCSHVLEHLRHPYEVLSELVKKLSPGGSLYIEVPSGRSLKLPGAASGRWGVKGCLNYHDDPTHITHVDLKIAAARLHDLGLAVTGPFRRRLLRRVCLLPLYALAGVVMRGYVPASVLWDVTGFADYLVATSLE